MAITYTDNYGFTIQQSGASATDKFSMAALNKNAEIADAELAKINDALDGKANITDIVTLTRAEYDALEEKTALFYFITEE